MGKILALDLGDRWTGIALSDKTRTFARPYATVETYHLAQQLSELISQEPISDIVVGLPTTLKGTISAQTAKVIAKKEELEKLFPAITWHFQNEQFSSQQAEELSRSKTKEEKLKSHARAAAFILQAFIEKTIPIPPPQHP